MRCLDNRPTTVHSLTLLKSPAVRMPGATTVDARHSARPAASRPHDPVCARNGRFKLPPLCFNSEFPVLGWRWTPQDPTAIHIYHQKLWKSSYKHHLYQVCNGFMLPIYYSIFDKPAPKISYQAGIDLTAIGRWFGEERFTYIRVFGSQANPHVLPLYIPDKLLAREIAYQITTESVT